ncbi:MAG: class I poly(R)-hydroxyalkanoic acid synthase, partial [Rhodospirillales bacterium]
TAQRMMGEPAPSVVEPEKGDKRFTHPDWEENAVFDFLKQSYLLSSKWMLETVRQVDGLDEQAARKVDFYTRQFIDALSPTNFVMSNPEVLRATLESHGENLLKGLENLLTDLERSKGQQLRITMTDPNAFKVGQDLAVTPGKVIYRNDLMEVIQYAPATEEVYQTPLLIVPPWINKFYILDLRPKNSFIKWATEQGFTVFAISWVNPDSSLGQKTFEDYLSEGPLAALEVIQSITGSESINGVGYCLGGTLLAIAMAYLESKGSPIIESGTFLTTMIDFQEAGELGVFIDEAQLTALEQQMSEQGYLDGASMANTFNLLRANDLIWSFVINNYLLGKEPFPFDLLYWNSDSTRMPGAMHSFYLRNMYQKNLLTRPGGISMLGTPIDLSGITCPAFFLSTREDHIAPWKSTFSGAKILSGETQFVLAASGHIAGVVNPPEKGK